MRNNLIDRLPHKPPFLLLDKVIGITANNAVALKEVKATDYYFQGHFPGNPIMPGVIILEAMFQTGGLLADKKYKLGYIATIDKVLFKKPVVPGDKLYLHVDVQVKLADLCRYKGVAYVGDHRVAQATWISTLIFDEKR